MKTVEECKKIAAEILGVDEKNLIQHIDGDIYGFYSEKDQTRDIAIDPRTGKEISLACQ